MSLFRKPAKMTIPEPYSADDIKTEASICTGERTIGFYDRASGRLMYAELVRSEKDISDFYKKYDIKKRDI